MKELKVVLVGDGAVGKTSLIMSYINGSFPTGYVPTIFDTTNVSVQCDKQTISVAFWDTAGKEDYDRLRPLSYPQTDVFLLCFSSISHDSLQNLKAKWIPEIIHHSYMTVGYVIVETKCDLYKHRIQKDFFEKAEMNHPKMLKILMSECDGYSSEDWILPSDLFKLILKWSEYTDEQKNYDERIESSLITQDKINQYLTKDLKFGLFNKEKRAAFVQTSALTQVGIQNEELMRAILETHQRCTKWQSRPKHGACEML